MTKPLFRPATIFEDETELEMPTLHAILAKKYGEDYVDWDSEVLKLEIMEDFGDLGVLTWNRIQAIRCMNNNESCWHEWEVFEKCCSASAGMVPDFAFVQQQEPEEVAILLYIMDQIKNVDFDKDVLGYIASTCMADGLYWLPQPLNVAQPMVDSHDDYYQVKRDKQAVTEALRKSNEYNENADTEAEEQANKIIRIRNSLEGFKNKLNEEAARYRSII